VLPVVNESAAESKEKAAARVPAMLATEAFAVKWSSDDCDGLEHVTLVPVVQLRVKQISSVKLRLGEKSRVPKPRPSTVMLARPLDGTFVPTVETTGASKEKPL